MDPWKGMAGCHIGKAARQNSFSIVLLGIEIERITGISAAAMRTAS